MSHVILLLFWYTIMDWCIDPYYCKTLFANCLSFFIKSCIKIIWQTIAIRWNKLKNWRKTELLFAQDTSFFLLANFSHMLARFFLFLEMQLSLGLQSVKFGKHVQGVVYTQAKCKQSTSFPKISTTIQPIQLKIAPCIILIIYSIILKQFWHKVDFIMVFSIKSYIQTQWKNWYKIMYVYSIDLYTQCICFYDEMDARFEFYA